MYHFYGDIQPPADGDCESMVSVKRSNQFSGLSQSQLAGACFLAVVYHNTFYVHKISIIFACRCAFTKSVPYLDAEIPHGTIMAATLCWLTTATSFD